MIEGWYDAAGNKVASGDSFTPSRGADGMYAAATYTVRVIPKTDTPFVIEYWLQDASGVFSKDASATINATGSTDLVLTITGDTSDGGAISSVPADGVITLPSGITIIPVFAGHSFSASASTLTGTIAADGSLALKLFYTNNALTNPTIIYNAGTGGSVTLGSEQIDITVSPIPSPVGSTPVAAPGYQFSHWQIGDDPDNQTKPGDSSLFIPSVPDGGWVEKTVYAFTAIFIELPEITINYVAGTGGTVSISTENTRPATGTPAGSLATANPGYAFDHWEDADGNVVMYDATNKAPAHLVPPRSADGVFVATTYKAIFVALPIDYTIQHYKVDRYGNVTLVKTDTGSDYAGTIVNAVPVDTTTNALWAGYTYAPGHSGEVATGVVMVDPALVLKLYYTANSDTPYVVYRYQLDGNGVFTQLTSENYTGYTDDLVSTTPNVPAGYQLVPDGTGASGTMAGLPHACDCP